MNSVGDCFCQIGVQESPPLEPKLAASIGAVKAVTKGAAKMAAEYEGGGVESCCLQCRQSAES